MTEAMRGVASLQTTLYRHFNADGVLLYVGISLSALYRLSQHADHSEWYNEISKVEMEHFCDRPSAMVAERKAVISEGPLHNIHHKKKPNKTRYQEYVEQSRDEMVARVVFKPVYNMDEVGAVIGGLRKSALLRLMDAGQLGYFLVPSSRPKCKPKRYVSGWQVIEYLENARTHHLQSPNNGSMLKKEGASL